MRASRTTSTGTSRPHLPTRTMRTAVVCLPADTPPATLPERAAAALAARGLTTSGVLPHFLTHTHRTGKLVDRWNALTSGGPIKLLNLNGMRTRAAAGAGAEWLLWQQVVAGTRPAQPFWAFVDRHAADPRRYPLARAQNDYLAQPRVLAMTAYNAVAGQSCPLPPSALEAFQAGYGTYLNVAWLAAVPGDGLAPQPGGWLTTRSQRLADVLEYLTTANAHLAQLTRDSHLVAVASPVWHLSAQPADARPFAARVGPFPPPIPTTKGGATMTIRLTFDLDTVCLLAEHAAAAAEHGDRAGTDHAGPALLLCSDSNGIWLTSNGLPAQAAPAGQPGTLERRAAFAQQCPPGTPWLDQVRLLRCATTPLAQVLPLGEPAGTPLLGQLRVAHLTGATTFTVLLSGTGLDIAVGRRRERVPSTPAAADTGTGGHNPPAASPRSAHTGRPAQWTQLQRQYRHLPHYERISYLMLRIQMLREDNRRLHDAFFTLIGLGVYGHRDEAGAKVDAIQAEARGISAELDCLGAHEAAELAYHGWTVTWTVHR